MSKSCNANKKEPYLCKLWKARSTKLPITNNIKDLKSGVRTKTWRGAKTRWPLARCEVIAPWRTVADCWLDPHHSYCHQQPPPAPLPLSMLSGCPVPPSSHTYNGPTGCLFIIGHQYLEKIIVFPKERRIRQHTVDTPWYSSSLILAPPAGQADQCHPPQAWLACNLITLLASLHLQGSPVSEEVCDWSHFQL